MNDQQIQERVSAAMAHNTSISTRSTQEGYSLAYLLCEDESSIQSMCCCWCNLVLRDPIQLRACGHKLCSLCHTHLVHSSTEQNRHNCPGCETETEMTPGDLPTVMGSNSDGHPDVWTRKAVRELKASCNTCGWKGKLVETDDHSCVMRQKMRRWKDESPAEYKE